MFKLYSKYLIFIILSLSCIYILVNRDNSSVNNKNVYAVTDTTKINKIFFADRTGSTILLEREKKKWRINNEHFVRKDAINILLNTISNIKIQKPVPLSHLEDVIKLLSTTGVKVEIYSNNELIRVYTVGGETPNKLGTYMFLEGSDSPFIMHVPGFKGYLSPRYGIQGFKVNPKTWRDREVFNFKSTEIKNIRLKHIQDSSLSFSLNLLPIMLYNYNNNNIPVDKNKVFDFINNFKGLNCEAFKMEKKYKINNRLQLHELIVNEDTLRTYQIRESIEIKKEDNFNVERMYATLNNGDLMLIQNYVFNKVLITIDELRK